MKVACYVHPIVHALGPNFTYGHFEIFADLLQNLRRDAAADCLLIAGSRFFRRAAEQGRSLQGLRALALDEVALYRKISAIGVLPTSLDGLACLATNDKPEALRLLANEIRSGSKGFIPDVVISFGIQIAFLRTIWPNALLLHAEAGPYSRNPYPDAAQYVSDPVDGFVPIADFDRLDWAWIKNAPAPIARELEPPIEDRYEQTQSQLKTLTACYVQANAQRAQMLESTSWRVTAPLRTAGTVLRKWRGRIFMMMTWIESKAWTLVHRTHIRGMPPGRARLATRPSATGDFWKD